MLLARPFKIVRIGPVRLFVHDVERCTAFYRDTLGLTVTEEVDVARAIAASSCAATPSTIRMALYPVALRAELGLRRIRR